ncbi:MAG TPA: ankyrin repeat domain-containing protein [Bryobacteraceae bacterium]|nr:ankyrin repeat domain-containing protein [Bryobacteraceae bacterium]
MRLLLSAVLTAALGAAADNTPPPILAVAAKGQTAQVKSLLDGGADIEAADRDGRTPLMLAAQHGKAETVRLLLARGAKSGARDRDGLTAAGLALFAPSGRGNHDVVLKLLPPVPHRRVALESGWTPAKLASSCFMNRDQLEHEVGLYRLDILVLDEFARYSASPAAKGLIEIVAAEKMGKHLPATSEVPIPAPAPDALVTMEVQPGTACGGTTDNATLSIDVRISRAADRTIVFQRSFAGGVKGLRVQPVDNPRQYQPVWESWIKPQGEPMFWAVAAALAAKL